MFFNSINFAIFLPLVFLLYWFATRGNLKVQNIILMFASYFFYACWDWRFVFLLLFSTLLDYYTGIKIAQASDPKNKKYWLWLSVCINLGFLGIFKYYNFFVASFADGLALLGLKANFSTLEIILPVGISFYTFHGLSYVIDIYRDKIKPEKNFIAYAVFVSFFPLLVAGPIERATHLLPQIIKKRIFDYHKTIDGLRQILWGLFKKIVIADNCAEFVDIIFNNLANGSADQSSSTLVLGAFFFTIQVYGDFSGYSDIALGTAKLFGIDLLRNFAYPYFSRNMVEFWRRWHISLSSWFRDYLYIPLGGGKNGMLIKIRNTFIIFLVSGIWHGASWAFVVWGLLNALCIMPSIIFNTNENNAKDSFEIVAKGKNLPTIKEFFSILLTFSLTMLLMTVFRSTSLTHAYEYISGIFSSTLFTMPPMLQIGTPIFARVLLVFILIFMVMEWLGREQQYALANLGAKWHTTLRWAMYYVLIASVCIYASPKQQFIYFQF